jgi:hypothetical protein
MTMNPLFIAYANDAHLYAEQYAGTTAVFVLGRANCIHDEWQRVRGRGSEILKYEIHIERPDGRVSAVDEEVYGGNSSTVPLWPYLDASGQQRCHKFKDASGVLVPNGAKFTDIRVGSVVVARFVDHVAQVIRSGRYSGMFLDGDGAQLFGAADWYNWPAGERQEWTAGMVDKARRVDEVRRAENPNFLIIGNNHWDIAPTAEKYVDGVVSENHPLTNLAMVRIVGKATYSPLGQRRVFTISRTVADAKLWAAVPGVTHVACTEENSLAGRSRYSRPVKPVVGYSNLRTSAPTYPDLSSRVAELQAQLVTASGERDAALAELDIARDEVLVLNASRSSIEAKLQAARARLSQIAADAAVEV